MSTVDQQLHLDERSASPPRRQPSFLTDDELRRHLAQIENGARSIEVQAGSVASTARWLRSHLAGEDAE